MDVQLRLENSVAVLRHHAKSFFWASLFLPKKSRASIADLYAVCRYIDDVSDENTSGIARRRLLELRTEVDSGGFLPAKTFEAWGIERRWLLDLIDGALYDTQFKPFSSERQLERYCYQVAGVVGLMMCPLLGVRERQAYQHAVDLGSAMQLTNIARDIAEDARRGRLYVPVEWLTENPHLMVKREWLHNSEGIEFTLREVGGGVLVRRLLEKAEGLYRSGQEGLKYIPWRTRLSIAVAAEIYQDIATALARQNFDPFAGRAYVSSWRKVWLSVRGLWRACRAHKNQQRSLRVSHNLTWIQSADDEQFHQFRQPDL